MPTIADTVRLLGGIASTGQLLRRGVPVDWIRMAVAYGRIVRVSKGWFASLDVPADAVEARRVGGKLACVSALRLHGVDESDGAAAPDSALHVAVRANASRLRMPAGREIVVHWYRRVPAGDALAVSIEEAWAQRARCRAVHRG